MDRREAVQYISLLLGGTLVGADAFISGCKSPDAKGGKEFTPEEIAYLNEIADTILPPTKTPGAKAANVGAFMPIMINDCYVEKDQKSFREGMKTINDLADKQYNKEFMQLDPQQRHDLLVGIDKEQKEYTKTKKEDDPAHYFRLMKEITLLGYFTSEIGCTQARRYVPVPGRFDGCIPYKKGDKAFA